MQKKWIAAITIIGILFIGGMAACHRGYHPGGFDEFDLAAATDRIASRIDMTDAQKADFKRIAGEIIEKAKAMRANHENRHQELADLVRQETLDKSAVDALIDTKLQDIRDLADFAVDRLIDFHGTLTPEQRETVAERIEAHSSGGCRFGWR